MYVRMLFFSYIRNSSISFQHGVFFFWCKTKITNKVVFILYVRINPLTFGAQNFYFIFTLAKSQGIKMNIFGYSTCSICVFVPFFILHLKTSKCWLENCIIWNFLLQFLFSTCVATSRGVFIISIRTSTHIQQTFAKVLWVLFVDYLNDSFYFVQGFGKVF